MSKKKHIDDLFQERFKDFEAVPDDSVWEKIKSRQQKKERKILLLPFWYRLAGAAAVITIISSLGFVFFTQKSTPTTEFVNKDTLTIKEEQTTEITFTNKNITKENQPSTINNLESNSGTSSVVSSKRDTTKSDNNPRRKPASKNPQNNTIPLISDKNTTKDKQTHPRTSIAKTKEQLKRSNTEIAKQSRITDLWQDKHYTTQTELDKLLLSNSEEKEEEEEEENSMTTTNTDTSKTSIYEVVNLDSPIKNKENSAKKWTIAPTIAPVFYNSLSNGSSIAETYKDNDKTSEANLSYGVQIAYTMSDRIQIRGGVHKLQLSYATQDVGLSRSIHLGATESSAEGDESLRLVDLSNQSSQNNSLSEQFDTDFIPNPTAIANRPLEGIARQRIGYIEVPLEITYAIINQRFGIQLIGGISTLLLNENENLLTFDTNDGTSTSLGKSENLNSFSFSSNLGLGINYKISQRLKVHLEPIFKHQINAYTSTTDFDPYIFGIYTGASFRF